MGLNLAMALHDSALTNPDKVAVIIDDVRLNYAQLDMLSDRLAGALLRSGVTPGDRIVISLPNVPQFIVAYYGILKAGAVVVPINVLLKSTEIAFHLQDSGARLAIAWEDFAAESIAAAALLAAPIKVYVAGRPGSPSPPGSLSFDELLAAAPEPGFTLFQSNPDETAAILYTSGTTGRPKGAELSHSNLFMNAWVSVRIVNACRDDVMMAVLPLFHTFGQSTIMNAAVLGAATVTLVPRFDAATVLQVMERDRVTVFAGVPTMYFGLLQYAGPGRDHSSLRMCVSGGSALPKEVMEAFEARFQVAVLEGYGLSETSPVATFNRSREERRPLSIGKPVWGVEVEIWDGEGHPMPDGAEHVGEIVIRGHNVMKGYRNQPDATRQSITNGWFHSEDLGYRDADGFLYIVDRKKDMILRGGFNVYPREIEEVLFQHPAIAAAAVIGVADSRLGEEIKAVVQLRAGQRADENEVIDFCRERLAPYKYPRSVNFVDSLPIGPTGKILKRQIRDSLAAADEPPPPPSKAGSAQQVF
ncbi:MAG TPA: long-chain fatty acid--CoA ligase [Candidatus Acidoferrales bacterium]|nr:long-chain fatty acid--CoA ligase [Candidatus Acidoferrales bacterium]